MINIRYEEYVKNKNWVYFYCIDLFEKRFKTQIVPCKAITRKNMNLPIGNNDRYEGREKNA